jgi:hypothetical protein
MKKEISKKISRKNEFFVVFPKLKLTGNFNIMQRASPDRVDERIEKMVLIDIVGSEIHPAN